MKSILLVILKVGEDAGFVEVEGGGARLAEIVGNEVVAGVEEVEPGFAAGRDLLVIGIAVELAYLRSRHSAMRTGLRGF